MPQEIHIRVTLRTHPRLIMSANQTSSGRVHETRRPATGSEIGFLNRPRFWFEFGRPTQRMKQGASTYINQGVFAYE
jgi:hypothetical protein